MMKNTTNIILFLFLSVAIVIESCKKELNKKFTDESNLLITSFISSKDNLKNMSELLKKGKLDALLNTYGSYTVLAPTDSAFNVYLNSLGIKSINDLDSAQVNDLLDYYVFPANLNLKNRNTGLLNKSDTTVSGLRHVVDLSQGFDHIILDKQALILSTDEVSNGTVYVIDAVLVPHPASIYGYLTATGIYNIMCEAIVAAGLQDTLQNVKQPFILSDIPGMTITPELTLFIEPDEVLANNGITSFQALKDAVWNNSKSFAADADQALEEFVKYHLYSGLKTTFKMYKDENITTLALNGSSVIHIDASADIRSPDPVLNSTVVDSVTVTGGIKLSYTQSDVSCRNGLVHQLNGILYIVENNRQSEIIRECEDGITIVPKRMGTALELEGIVLGGRGEIYDIPSNSQFYSSRYDDYGQAVTFNPVETGDYIEFTIRNVATGTYKVLLNFRRDRVNSSSNVNVYWRNSEENFDWSTQILKVSLDMADKNDALKLPEFRQNYQLGSVVITEVGDYIIRFAQVDLGKSIYDNIILEPVK